jgi:hypothetical protein
MRALLIVILIGLWILPASGQTAEQQLRGIKALLDAREYDAGLERISVIEKSGITNWEFGAKTSEPDTNNRFGLKMIDTFSNKLNAEHEILNDNGIVVRLRINKYKLAS